VQFLSPIVEKVIFGSEAQLTSDTAEFLEEQLFPACNPNSIDLENGTKCSG